MRKLICIAIIALSIVACAKEEGSDTSIEQASLDAWMQKHTSGFTRHDEGLYTRVLQANPADTALARIGDWVEIDFTGYTLPDLPVNPTGNMFVTRDAAIAAAYGTSTLKTHYAPKKVFMSSGQSDFTFTVAMLRTLMMMHPGETYEFYAPSPLAYQGIGTSSYTYGDWGYQGPGTVSPGAPSRMEIKLVRIIGNDEAATRDEQRQVETFALERLGLAASDSLKANLYLKQTLLDPTADSIAADSTCYIYYVGSLLDGFVFDTNIDSIAARLWGDHSKHDSLRYTPASGGLIEAFRQAVDTMRYDSWGEMVFSSRWGYPYGQTPTTGSGSTEIDAHTPLHFKFYILPKKIVADSTDAE